MKKVKISITVNSIYFSYTNTTNIENLNKTSYIETGNLIFDYEYISKNGKLIASFINDITTQTKINTIKIKNIELVPLILKVLKNNKQIKKLYILDNKTVDTNSFLTIVDNNIEYLNCYNMPNVMFNYLNSRKDILIELRSEMNLQSKFTKENKLNNYSTIFYKKNIIINDDLTNIDLNDLEAFLIINQNLQKIFIKKYSLQNIKEMYSLLAKYQKKNIKIIIYQNTNNINIIAKDIDDLKNLKSKNINIKIVYEKDYILKNILKQINLSLVRFSVFFIFIVLLTILTITKFTTYKEDKKTEEIINRVQNINNQKNEEINLTIQDDLQDNNDETHIADAYQTEYEQIFSQLKKINKETIGWLKINNIDVDHPIVQAKDNEYYLKHSFDKKKNSKGWLFADYRNHFDNLDDNTIIYGHNLKKSGYMFGSLKKVLEDEWYNDKNNQIISFNTIYNNYNWQILSIYTIEKNND